MQTKFLMDYFRSHMFWPWPTMRLQLTRSIFSVKCITCFFLHGKIFLIARFTMPSKSLTAQATIIGHTLDEDRKAVAEMWYHTLKSNPIDDAATNITKIMLACVACGDFKTKSAFSDQVEMDNPNPILSVVDYLSHASRIIFDYSKLSPANQEVFLSFFPIEGQKAAVSRCATHAVWRAEDKIIEGKGLFYGAMSQLPAMMKVPADFGLNIAMGGSGRTNYTGKKISNNGYSGHLYFNRNDTHQLIMAGLEQSAPVSFSSILSGHAAESPEVQSGHDQFDQSHSIVGHSDTYTAAGSLYFSDPVYQAKLLAETGFLPPDKYGAMQVTLNDRNWPHICGYFEQLNEKLSRDTQEAVIQQLLMKPSTHTDQLPEMHSFIPQKFSFSEYLKKIRVLLEVEEVPPGLMHEHLRLQQQLLSSIIPLQKAQVTTPGAYLPCHELIDAMCSLPQTPPRYQAAVQRIALLIRKQCSLDPGLDRAGFARVNQQAQTRCIQTLETITTLEEKIRFLQIFYSSEYVSDVDDALHRLSTYQEILARIKESITLGAELKGIEPAQIDRHQQFLERIALLLREQFKLPSVLHFNRLETEHARLCAAYSLSQTEVLESRSGLETLETEYAQLRAAHSLSRREVLELRSGLERLETEHAQLRAAHSLSQRQASDLQSRLESTVSRNQEQFLQAQAEIGLLRAQNAQLTCMQDQNDFTHSINHPPRLLEQPQLEHVQGASVATDSSTDKVHWLNQYSVGAISAIATAIVEPLILMASHIAIVSTFAWAGVIGGPIGLGILAGFCFYLFYNPKSEQSPSMQPCSE